MNLFILNNENFRNNLYIVSYSKRLLLFLIFLFLTYQLIFTDSQNLNPNLRFGFKKNIKNFTATKNNQLWSNQIIFQDKRGIIYVGNSNLIPISGNLYQYDGVAWQKICGPKYGVRAITTDNFGNIYIGGYNQFGFLIQDSNGEMKYKSIDAQLDKDKKNFGPVYKIHSTKQGIYFNCLKFLIRKSYQSGKLKVWSPTQNNIFLSSFKFRDEFLIQQENVGLMRIENDELKLIPGSKFFKDKEISMMAPFSDQTILIGTLTKGLFLFDGSKNKPFITQANEFLNKNHLRYGIRLSDGNFALGTSYGGLLIIDTMGKVIDIFDKSYGLLNNTVNHILEDMEGNLWLALMKGISRIEYRSPVSINENISPYIFSIVRHQGALNVGTDNGIYTLKPNGKFHHIHSTHGYYFDLHSIDDSIFAATQNGIRQLKGRKNYIFIDNIRFFCLLQSQFDKKRIWAAGMKGLFSLYKHKDGWKKEHHFKNITQRIESIAEDKIGNLWLGLNNLDLISDKIVLKLDFSDNGYFSSPMVTGYQITPLPLPNYACNVYKAAGHILFSTIKGLFRFDEKSKMFIPDLTFGIKFAGGTITKSFLRIAEDKNKNVWLRLSNSICLAKYMENGSYKIQSKPFRRIQSISWFSLYPDPNENITWVGDIGRLTRFDIMIKKNYEYNFPTLIRRVVANGNLIYGGNKINESKDSQLRNFLPSIDYKDRDLSFEFAAPFYTDESSTQYRYFLEGYDTDWSKWGWKTKREYNSLTPGFYRFRTQSKNVYQHPGSEAVFQFRILLPWYRTWWAFLSYVIIFLMVSYLTIKWRRSFQLEKEKQKLEQTVDERTKVIKIKNQQLEEQSEKLKEMDKVKSRFFANISHEFRTPLTLIMGPLEQIISRWHNKDLQKKANIALQNSQRLLDLINQLLDLSKLDSGKMKLQLSQQNIGNFLKGIVSSFEPVIDEKGLELTLNFQKENITIYFDPYKLEHIILNLLANAVKFTPTGGKILIEFSEKNLSSNTFPSGFLEITVYNTGPGIPKGELEHIFDRFYQAESTYKKNPQGSGVGLALAKELVELHRGELDISSSEGEGTEFIIRLPMGESHLNAVDIVPHLDKPYEFKNFNKSSNPIILENEQELIDKNKIIYTDFRDEPKGTSEIGSITTEENPPNSKTEKDIILVVEDSDDLRNYIKESLEPLYHVVESKNGHEGIQKSTEIIPDLVISDIMMPEVDGYELCGALKNNIKTSHIPIILLTAKASEDHIIEGLETGADDYITKPFSTKVLCARIKNLIDLRFQLQLKRKRQMTFQPTEIKTSSIDEEFYHELQKVIEKKLSDPDFGVDQLAKSLYLGRSSLYRKLMALTGETPRQFIRTYRLKRAAQLLKANFGNVTQVSQEVGFSSMAHFTQCFKKEFHQLPSQFQSAESLS